jgi:hypothetical protein
MSILWWGCGLVVVDASLRCRISPDDLQAHRQLLGNGLG